MNDSPCERVCNDAPPVWGERARIVEALEIRDHVVEALGAQKERIRESFDQHFLRLATERRSRRNAKIP